MNVNPFAIPAESSTYRFSPNFLYQFKIDNTGDAVEDLVIQVQFVGNGVHKPYSCLALLYRRSLASEP